MWPNGWGYSREPMVHQQSLGCKQSPRRDTRLMRFQVVQGPSRMLAGTRTGHKSQGSTEGPDPPSAWWAVLEGDHVTSTRQDPGYCLAGFMR
jgi:hypothetical protein